MTPYVSHSSGLETGFGYVCHTDFTHMPTLKQFQYLLFWVDTFSDLFETYPTANQNCHLFITILLFSIIVSHFGMTAYFPPVRQQSRFHHSCNTGPNPGSTILQHFHISYRPQFSGKVDYTNRNLKSILTKFTLKLHLDYTKLLHLVLHRLCSIPHKPSNPCLAPWSWC